MSDPPDGLGGLSRRLGISSVAAALRSVLVSLQPIGRVVLVLLGLHRLAIQTGDCQEFRVEAAIVDPKEVSDGTTQSTPHP